MEHVMTNTGYERANITKADENRLLLSILGNLFVEVTRI